MNAYTELIDKYLNNELSAEARKAFEEQLKTNPALKTEFDLQSQVIKGVQRMALKNQVKTSFKKTKTTKTITKAVIAAGITVAVLATGYFVKKQLAKEKDQATYEWTEESNISQTGTTDALPAEILRINPLHDTVIETRGGILFAIEANTFLDPSGKAAANPVELEIKEALLPFDIMKAGLSTVSDGKLLETGGMFYLGAKSGNDSLHIDPKKPIQASVPYSGTRNDMMLFDGKREADGRINWVNPVKTVKQLTTTEITKLNFYPPGYLDSLKKWGYNIKDKKFTDSLYYSFICSGGADSTKVVNKSKLTKEELDSVVTEVSILPKLSGATATSKVSYSYASAKDGRSIFKASCAVCHSMCSYHLTGPGMAGLARRVPSRNWVIDYIKNNEKMIKAKDPYALKILKENGGAAMTVFEGTLTSEQLQMLTDYILRGDCDEAPNDGCPEINPSRIKAIWDRKFNNSILATHEFEERLQAIFQTCDQRLLSLYINNLDKNLYEIDSMAAYNCKTEKYKLFLDFYNRRDGAVKIENKKMRQLQQYASEKKRLYEKAALQTMQKLWKNEQDKNDQAWIKWDAHFRAEWVRNNENFTKELDINLESAFRQVGKTYIPPTRVTTVSTNKTPVIPPSTYVSAPIINTGWKNVDAFTREATFNRTSLNYTDNVTGKKAVIQYKPVNITVEKNNEYDRILGYLIPDQLSSFQLMKTSPTGCTENLNELLHYNLVVIGIKGDKMYYSETTAIAPQNYTIALKESSEKQLREKLNTSYSLLKQDDVLKDIQYQFFDIKETERQKKTQEREQFKVKLYPIVFPCADSYSMYEVFEM
jgi:mono/diheme cytochrome c family protein